MEIILSIDSRILEAGRRRAAALGITLDEYVERMIVEDTSQHDKLGDLLSGITDENRHPLYLEGRPKTEYSAADIRLLEEMMGPVRARPNHAEAPSDDDLPKSTPTTGELVAAIAVAAARIETCKLNVQLAQGMLGHTCSAQDLADTEETLRKAEESLANAVNQFDDRSDLPKPKPPSAPE